MHAFSEITGIGAHFDRQHAFGNQFASSMTDNADAENAIGFRFQDQFCQTIRAIVSQSTTGSGPREFGDFNFDALWLWLRLRSIRTTRLLDR